MKKTVSHHPDDTRVVLCGIGTLALLTIALFGDALVTSKDMVLGDDGADMYYQFVHWRGFGFEQLQQGNLALWNPHIYSGAPFFGGAQSALLYPFNLIFLVLPLSKALNLSIALHVFLAGVFMYLWTRARNLHPVACTFSAMIFMLCGPFFLHIYPGHLPNVCAMIWAPLIFLSIEHFKKKGLLWILIGIAAVSMQILAGHLQYVFYTGIAALIYAVLLMSKTKYKILFGVKFILLYISAICITAVQLLTGIEAASECVRTGGVSFEFASICSFPPENLFTLFLPGLFGDRVTIPYWGRWYVWEVCAFIGVTGCILSLYGVIKGDRKVTTSSIIMTLILIVLAFGSYTPLFKILYTLVPGFNQFRGSSKFIYLAVLFIIMLAGIGYDYLLRNYSGKKTITPVLLILGAGVVIALLAFFIRSSFYTICQAVVYWVRDTKEYFYPEIFDDSELTSKAGMNAFRNMMYAAGVCGIVSLLIFLSRYKKVFLYGIAIVAIFEMLTFSRAFRPTFDLTSITGVKENIPRAFFSNDIRVKLVHPNMAMTWNLYDIWGHDPYVLKRYSEFIFFTQEKNPDNASQNIRIMAFHELFALLRSPLAQNDSKNKFYLNPEIKALPRVSLLSDWVLVKERDSIFATMKDERFDPFQTVILESTPDPLPEKTTGTGKVDITDSSTDHLTIECETPGPSILLITDTYSKGWKATPLPGNEQTQYTIMPANYFLRAIPLTKGHHRIQLEYLPTAFIIGKWVTILSFFVYISILMLYCFDSFKSNFIAKIKNTSSILRSE